MVDSRSERIAAIRSQLSPNQLFLKDTFVYEYLKDYDAYRAAICCGMNQTAAKRWVRSYISDPYIQLCISEAEEQEFDENHNDRVKKQIDVTFAKLMSNPKVSAQNRIAAAKARAEMLGLNAPSRINVDATVKKVIFLMPATMSAAEWEAQTMASQTLLVADAQAPT